MCEQRVSKAVIELADTLDEQFDIAAFLRRLAQLSVDLLAADAARVMLADNHATLQVVASSSPAEALAGLPPPATPGDGPGPESYESGRSVMCADLETARAKWPAYSAIALAAGFRSVHTWPLTHRHHVIGAIEIYRTGSGQCTDAEAEVALTLVHLATISVLRERRRQDADTLAGQLQQALNSRLVIEQAKGILAERVQLGVDQAFALLRGHARRHQLRLATLAAQVVDGTYDTSRLIHTELRARLDARSGSGSRAGSERRGGRSGATLRAGTSNDRRGRNGR
ncbi:GAF and ANTAR domain-containing protein [Actinopolymorpha sp. B9G3]|uniref:GAF and ANTAR domain-containing protein n=1 Tax=Actinopolymorpha sp. B9G3 TaxID=3158970 RepID=UPI0032D9094A